MTIFQVLSIFKNEKNFIEISKKPLANSENDFAKKSFPWINS